MSHKDITERIKIMSKNLSRLDELIPQYALNKKEMDDYKEICDKENAEIKKLMTDLILSSYETGEYKATCSISERKNLNEEVLLALFSSVPSFVKINQNCGIIKERPYIDFDALEKAIYDGRLNQDQLLELDKATEVKKVTTLRVTKIKKKEKK